MWPGANREWRSGSWDGLPASVARTHRSVCFVTEMYVARITPSVMLSLTLTSGISARGNTNETDPPADSPSVPRTVPRTEIPAGLGHPVGGPLLFQLCH